MVLCDTNFLINAFNGNTETINELENIEFKDIVLSSITEMEPFQGMRNKVELAQMKKKIKYYNTIEIDLESSKMATLLIEEFNLSYGLQIPDALIGACSVVNQMRLFTYNTKDFYYIPRIELYDPI